jgi:hypothetical protein
MQKDTERKEELLKIKRSWNDATVQRAASAMQRRRTFLDSLKINIDEQSMSFDNVDDKVERTESTTSEPAMKISSIVNVSEKAMSVSNPSDRTEKKSSLSATTKKSLLRETVSKRMDMPIPVIVRTSTPVSEPLLYEPPPIKPKIILPSLDIQPFVK